MPDIYSEQEAAQLHKKTEYCKPEKQPLLKL